MNPRATIAQSRSECHSDLQLRTLPKARNLREGYIYYGDNLDILREHIADARLPIFDACLAASRGKAEKYPLSDVSLHGCPVKCCPIGLFVAALP